MSEPLGPGWAPKKPPPSGDGEAAPKPKRFWWRFSLAALLIVAVSAAATSIAVLNYFDSIAEALSTTAHNDKVDRFLAEVEGGEPQNFLILGSDKRAGDELRRQRPLGHDDPDPPRPRQGGDLDALDPARPEGRNPRLRHRQVQRSVFLRRAQS